MKTPGEKGKTPIFSGNASQLNIALSGRATSECRSKLASAADHFEFINLDSQRNLLEEKTDRPMSNALFIAN